jgi:hypothetical protein
VSTNRSSRNRASQQRRSGQPPRTGQQRAGQPRTGQPRRPLPQGQSLYTPGASGARRAVERRSAAPLAYLHQLPALVPPLVLAVLLVTGLAVKGPIGAVALGCVAAVLGWLAFVSWPGLTGRGRAGRAAAIACVLAVAVLQATR